MNGSLNIETTPLTRTSQMNDITRETKGQAKRKNSERQLAQPGQTLTQGGHEIGVY